jgi:hypothetical protein
MPKATPDYNLFVLKPDLVKEWHPTKNGTLRPCDVTPGSGRKVWWICEAGHEWQAVIYGRSRGNGCRFCNRSTKIGDSRRALSIQDLIKEWHPTKNGRINPRNVTALHQTIGGRMSPRGSARNEIHQKDLLDTYFGTDFRKSRRYQQEATAIVEVPNSGHMIYAQMQNLSKGGMYFETEIAIKPGTRITIKFDKPVFHSASRIYVSNVRWCKGLADDRGIINTYGFGVKFI